MKAQEKRLPGHVVSEVPNDRAEEFGLARLERLLKHAAQPLPHIWERIMEQVRQPWFATG